MKNNPVPYYSTFQPNLSYRLRHSRALKPLAVTLGVLLMAFMAFFVISR